MKTKTATLWIAVLIPMVLASPAWSVEAGEPAPDFSMRSFDGSAISRTALEGRPMLLIFWNTWCPICMRELPEINRLAEKLGPKRLAVLAVNTAINDSEARARAYWEKSEYVFPSGFDRYFEMGTAFRVMGVPTIVLVDSKGVVRYKHTRIPGDLEARLKELTTITPLPSGPHS